MKILYPTSIPLELTAPSEVEYQPYDPLLPIPSAHHDASALVVWGNPPALLAEAAKSLHQIRWVQTLSAGPDALFEASFAKNVTLTSGRGLHDSPVAEHALAMLLSGVRRLHEMSQAQQARSWPAHLRGAARAGAGDPFQSLSGANITIWGFGSIGKTLAGYLSMLGATVTGVARSRGTWGEYTVLAADEVDILLPSTDALVMILPATPATHHALSARRLALLPRHAWVVNVGRGTTVDEAAIISALEAEQIAGAALDVFEDEPLPTTSRLWGLKNAIISPHAAGGRPIGAATLIEENARRLVQGVALRNVVQQA